MSDVALYLRLVLMDLHGGSHRRLYIVPLRLRGVKYFHWVGSPRDLEKKQSGGEKDKFCFAAKAEEDEMPSMALHGVGQWKVVM